MPSLNNDVPTSGPPIVQYNNSIVEVTDDWGDWNWQYVPYLVCKRMDKCLPPETGLALLEYRTGNLKPEDQPLPCQQVNPLNLLGLYVRVSIQYPQSDPVPVYYGVIEDQQTVYLQDNIPSGDQTFTARSIEYVLDRCPINGAVGLKQNPANDGPDYVTVTLNSPWAFNRQAKVGYTVQGNRSKQDIQTTLDANDSEIPGGVYAFSSDGHLWANYDILLYFFQFFGPLDTDLQFYLEGNVEPLQNMKMYHDFHSHEKQASTVWAAVTRLINRKQAMTFSTLVDDETGDINLYVDTVTDFPLNVGGLTIPPNSNPVTFSLPPDDLSQSLVDDLPLTMTDKNNFGMIEVFGAKIKMMAPFAFTNNGDIQANNLQHGGSGPALKQEYDTAPAVPANNGQQDPSACDRFRAKPKYKDVYQTFTVPQLWDGTDGNNNNWMPISQDDGTVVFLPKYGEGGYNGSNKNQGVTGGGPTDAPGAQFIIFEKHFDKHLPIKIGVDYTKYPPVNSNPIPNEAEYCPLQVWYKDLAAGGIHANDGLWHNISKFREDNPKVKNMTVHVCDTFLGVHIEGDPNHYLGLNSFTGQSMHIPELDYHNLMVLGSFDTDERMVVRWFNTTDNERTFTQYLNSARYVYAVPGCPVQISSQGTITEIEDDSRILINDRKVLQQVLAEMVCWYGRPRQCVEIVVKQPGLFVDVGCFLTEVDTAFSVEPIGTIINKISIDFDNQRTTIKTAWDELDYVALLGREETTAN